MGEKVFRVRELHCPVCGAPEVNPNTGLLNIRGFKVMLEDDDHWWSDCLTGKHGDKDDVDEKGQTHFWF